jgi:hypothetical protein
MEQKKSLSRNGLYPGWLPGIFIDLNLGKAMDAQ